jgi:hypothetical protein
MAVWNAPAPGGFRWDRSDAGPSNRRAVTTTNLASDAAIVRAPAVMPLAQHSAAGQSPTLHASGMYNAHEPRLAVSDEQAKDVAARRRTARRASLSGAASRAGEVTPHTSERLSSDRGTAYRVEDATCSVCPHTVGAHDRIAERYCHATLDNALTRGCICPPA